MSTVIHRLVPLMACLTIAACGGTSTVVPEHEGLRANTGASGQATPSVDDGAERNPMVESADRAIVEGRFRDARPAYASLIADESAPDNLTRARLLHASTLVAAGLSDDAASEVLDLMSATELSLQQRAFALGLLGRAQQCAAVLQTPGLADDIDSSHDVALVAGICAIEMGQTSLAHAYLSMADASAPAKIARGLLAWVRGETEPAAAHFERALQQDPDSLDALRNYGMLLWQIGDRDGARQQLLRYLDLAPPSLSDRARVQAMLDEE